MAGRYDSSHVLYMQDEGGTEEWHIYAVDVTQRNDARPDAAWPASPLTSTTWYSIIRASLPSPSTIATRPGTMSIASIFARAERELIVENTQELASIVLDRQLRPRLATKSRPEGGSSVFRIDGTGAGADPAWSITKTT